MKFKRTPLKNNIPLASMSDIAFLLLIFMILVSLSSTSRSNVKLPFSKSINRENKESSINIVIFSEKDILVENLQTNGLEENIAEGIKGSKENNTIRIEADRNIPFKSIKKILTIAQKLDIDDIQFVVIGEENNR